MRELAHRRDVLDRASTVAQGGGITPSLAKALALLSLDHPTPMRELAGALRCDASYVTSVADGLEQHGLAKRMTHPTDRRIKVIEVTPEGADVAERIRAALAEPPAEMLGLTAGELETLLNILHKLES